MIILLSVVMAIVGFVNAVVRDRRRHWVVFSLVTAVWMALGVWVIAYSDRDRYDVVLLSGLGGLLAGSLVVLARYVRKGWATWHD